MILYTTVTLEKLVEWIYEKRCTIVANPNYKPTVTECGHYASVSEVKTPYCGQCGSKNDIVILPKTIEEIQYRRIGQVVWENIDPYSYLYTEMLQNKAIREPGPGLNTPITVSSYDIEELGRYFKKCKRCKPRTDIDPDSKIFLILYEFEEVTAESFRQAAAISDRFTCMGFNKLELTSDDVLTKHCECYPYH
jgi:hypothetical protein